MTTPDKPQFEFPEGMSREEEANFIKGAFWLAVAAAQGAAGIIKVGLSFLEADSQSTDSTDAGQSD